MVIRAGEGEGYRAGNVWNSPSETEEQSNILLIAFY